MSLRKLLALVGLLVIAATSAHAQNAYVISNASSTGTTVNLLATGTGAPQTAVVASTTQSNGTLGVVVSGAGTTGSAVIQFEGVAVCVFDGATTSGDWVQASTSTGGDCHDSGVAATAALPTGNQVVGVVTSTNGSAGSYNIQLRLPPQPQGSLGIEIDMFYSGVPTASAHLNKVFSRATTVAASAPIKCSAQEGATSSATVTLNHVVSGTPTSIGTLVFAASGGAYATCTVTFSSTVNFAVGDALTAVFPGTADATLGDVAISIPATQ